MEEIKGQKDHDGHSINIQYPSDEKHGHSLHCEAPEPEVSLFFVQNLNQTSYHNVEQLSPRR